MRRRILIADDMETNRVILRRGLEREYDILEAENGADALSLLKTERESVSAVLLDIVMPELDGFEVLRRMRAEPLLENIPVIVVTANLDQSAENRALSLGANDYVTKPYHLEAIRHRLRNTIRLRETAAMVNLAESDSLTGLYNRDAFLRRASAMIAEKEAGYYVLSCMDVDGFKVINDQYGSAKGDEVLKTLADVFRRGIGGAGGICCRIAADNYAVLYPRSFMDSGGVDAVQQEASELDGALQPVTISTGRYVADDKSLSISAMYDRAMLAQATVKGRYDAHVALYDESMRTRLLRQQEIVDEMKEALQNHQFEVWFQPQYNHSTGEQIGAEALVRWRHPRRGLISPAEFIPLFEKNGFIYELDKFVWEDTCRQLRRWTDEEREPLPVSVNVSRYDVFRPDLLTFLESLLEKYELHVDMLRLEITESAFSHSTEQIIRVVRQLVERGFTVEIDDFGSGYSSLNTLKDVPAQIIKLDTRFLEANDNSTRGGNILESVVRMAKWLGVAVIAEGVETLPQADYLRSIGCSYVQGYLYARPMPRGDYETVSEQRRKAPKLLALQTIPHLDNDAFWDPDSMDTLIFNSYVGGACIFEYQQGHIELLRATEKFVRLIGGVGVTVADALALDWTSYLDAESRRYVAAAAERSAKTHDEIPGEVVFRNLPGCAPVVHLRCTLRVIAVAGDRCLVYCTNENITAQRQAEQKERASARQLEIIMQNINGGVCAVTINSRGMVSFVYANDQYYALFGYTRRQFEIEMPDAFRVVHPDDVARVRKCVANVIVTHRSDVYEYRCLRRDGSVIHVRCSAALTDMPGVNGKVLLSVVTDVTQLSQAIERERAATAQLQAIMDNAGAGIVASVVEDGEKVTLLFSNDRYYELLGYTREQYEAAFFGGFGPISPKDRARVVEAVSRITSSGDPLQLEYRADRLDGTEIWVRQRITDCRFPDLQSRVQLSIITDVTAEREALARMRRTDEQLRFLNDISRSLLAKNNADDAICDVLRETLEYFDGARACLVEFDAAGETSTNTYEICAHGVASQKDKLQNLPNSGHAALFTMLDVDGYVTIPDAAALDEGMVAERELLASQDVHSVVAVPLRRDGSLIGFVDVDDPTEHLSDVDHLRAIGDYISVLLMRRDLNARIEADSENIRGLMHDTPGGFARVRLNPDGTGSMAYANDGFLSFLGYTGRELLELCRDDCFVGIPPEDAAQAHDAIAAAMAGDGHVDVRYRLPHKNGGLVPTHMSGRISRPPDGHVYMNAYYAPLPPTRDKDE